MIILLKKMIYLTRIERFNAAHKLYNDNWTEEKNKEVFGKCSNANWHGHNYELHVTLKGKPHPDTGFVYNAKELADIIKTHIIDKVDHCNLNVDVDFMKGKLTSVENLAIAIWDELKPHVEKDGVKLHCIKLHETATIYTEYYGEA
jgi:6-pyruvoyltetrahydropterin/6-carboxytetrahydropterin synthase